MPNYDTFKMAPNETVIIHKVQTMKITNTQPGALTVAGIDIQSGANEFSPAQSAAIKEAAPWAFETGWLVTDEPKKPARKPLAEVDTSDL